MYGIDPERLSDKKAVSQAFTTLNAVELQSYNSLKQEVKFLRRRVAELEKQVLDPEPVPFRLLVESVNNHEIIMLDPNGYVLSWNAGAERLKGYKAEEIIGKHFSCFYQSQDIDSGKPEEALLEALSQGSCEVEGWRVRRDGSLFWAKVITTSLRDKDGRLIGFSELTRDYTDRKRMQEAQTRLTAILEATTDFVGIADPQGRVLYLNQAGRQMLGLSRTEDISNIDIASNHPRWARKILQEEAIPTATSEGVWTGETAVLSHDGREIPVSQVILAHKSPQGELEFFSCIARDISDRKQAEAEIQKSLEKEKELTELKYRFVSMAYHEFRTPLSTILISSDLLKTYGCQLSEEKKLKQLNKIQVAVKRMTGLLDDTLSVSKAQAGRIEFVPHQFDLKACCQDVAEEIELTSGENHSIIFECSGDNFQVEMDERLIRQMLTNLLSNAVKYSPKGGRVEFKLNCESGLAMFTIQDEGIGIPAADRERLFEVFHRGSNVGNIGGTGLGTVIIKQAVELHGGKISLESLEGEGTTFIISMATQQNRGQIRCASPVETTTT